MPCRVRQAQQQGFIVRGPLGGGRSLSFHVLAVRPFVRYVGM